MRNKAGLISTAPLPAPLRGGLIFLTGVGFVSYHSPDRLSLPSFPDLSSAAEENGDQFVTNLLTSPLLSAVPSMSKERVARLREVAMKSRNLKLVCPLSTPEDLRRALARHRSRPSVRPR